MKKRILLVGISMMLCLLGGCLEVTPITDAEMDVVAEYAASLLLKYDKNYDTPLYYAENREVQLTPTPTPTEKPKNPTATPTPSAGNTTSSGNNAQGEASATPTPVPLYNQEETTGQLTKIINVDNVTVSCKGYELMKSVQSTEYFSLVAKDGRQYVVVSFTLHNNTDSDVIFDASGKGLEYTLDVNVSERFRVSLSMLENDLQYMEITVPANKTAEAVLVFEIADTEIDTIHLIVEDKEDNVVFVKLK